MRSVRMSRLSLCVAVLASLLLVSCASRHAPPLPEGIAPSVLSPVAQAGVTDGRARFREIFKEVLSRQCTALPAGTPCDDGSTLWKLAGEGPPTGKPVPSGPSAGNFRVVLVPGLLAECVAEKSRAFDDSRSRLEELNFKTDYIQTRGRQRSAVNADLINDAVARMPAGEKLIFVTHSKGTVDTLEALVRHPALAERIVAVVSVSGAVNGSPLAEAFPDFLYTMAHELPLSSCPQGEGMEAIESLRRNVRLSWLATHPLPASVRYYSLAAFTTRENASLILHPCYDILSRTEPVNDGMVLCSDAVVPGSVLLGYPNADHLAVAMPFSKERSPMLTGLINKNAYPRAALLEAAVRFVEEDLARSGR